MTAQTFAYLDLTALPAVGALLLDPRPVWVFGSDGTSVLWTNAAGARFFAAGSIDALLDRGIGGANPVVKQLGRLARTLPTEAARLEILRFASGFRLNSVAASCRRLNLPGGRNAVLAVAISDCAVRPLAARAESLAEALAGDDCLVAVGDASGRIVAASDDLDDLSPASTAIDLLVESVRRGPERLARQSIQVDGAIRPAGAARFDGGGEDFTLVIVGPAADLPQQAENKLDTRPADTADTTTAEPDAPPAPSQPSAPPVAPAIRFLWQVDGDNRFTFVSDELARTVGNASADIVGRTWREVADRLGIDRDGRVQAALDAHSQWSGVGFYWPTDVAGVGVAVELGAFPVSERGTYAGQRGFGILRPDDQRREAPPSEDSSVSGAPDETERAGAAIGDPGEASAALRSDTAAPAGTSNIVPLPGSGPVQAPESDGLSGNERAAFRRIAESLNAGKPPAAAATDHTTDQPALHGETGDAAVARNVDTSLLDDLPVGIVVSRQEATLFVNRTLLDLLGYDSAEDFAAAGGRDAVFAEPGAAPESPPATEADGSPPLVRRKDRHWLAADAHMQPVSWAGEPALLLAISPRPRHPQPPTEALRDDIAAAEIRLGELEAILDTATDGVVVIDAEGRICNLNRSTEALFGIEASDVLGTPFTGLFAEESHRAALDYLDGLAANGVASVLNDGREVIGKVPQGGLIPMFMTMGRLGGTGKFCAVLRDITHWKNVEEEFVAARHAAETANTQKSEFLAKISHEIRTPLNAIIGFSEVMMEERFGAIGNPRYRDYLRDIHMSGTHLMSLINDLLDLSKIEAGKFELAFEAVAPNHAIQECVALMQPQANRERIIIRTSLSSELPDVVADARSLRQILLNLLSNAIKFTEAGGQVIVSTAIENNGEVAIRVRDTGVGMSEKDIETALQPFRQLATTGRDRSDGTGLGLPLTKALVEANRASFTIDSTVNQGTLVKITFPTTRVLAG